MTSGKRAVEQETSAAAAKLLSKLHNINTIITAEAEAEAAPAAVLVAATTAITDTRTAITISRATTTTSSAGKMSLGKKQQTYVKVWQFQRFLPRANMIFGNRKAGKRKGKAGRTQVYT